MKNYFNNNEKFDLKPQVLKTGASYQFEVYFIGNEMPIFDENTFIKNKILLKNIY